MSQTEPEKALSFEGLLNCAKNKIKDDDRNKGNWNGLRMIATSIQALTEQQLKWTVILNPLGRQLDGTNPKATEGTLVHQISIQNSKVGTSAKCKSQSDFDEYLPG